MKLSHIIFIGCLFTAIALNSACKHEGTCAVHCNCTEESGFNDTTYYIKQEVAEVSCEGYAEIYNTIDCPCEPDWKR
ncbi:MAG: hypothetical protein JXB49_22570 [Bacteroidales bacterium]|nr:hypothetical protein [Bacteroidales bacterium]